MSVLTMTSEQRRGADQARHLRALVADRGDRKSSGDRRIGARTLTLLSGKGGVGKSVLALNLALAFKRQVSSAGLIDASVGSSHLGLLCGLNGYWNFEHVLAGSRKLADVLLNGPNGLPIVPGAAPLLSVGEPRALALQDLAEFQKQLEWLIVDTCADLSLACRAASCSDGTLIVTTPEPTSIAMAYSAMKMLSAVDAKNVSVLVNQVDSEDQAKEILDRLRRAARAFLGADIGLAGSIPQDRTVTKAVSERCPIADVDRTCPAWQSIEQVVRRLTQTTVRCSELPFVEQLRRVTNAADRVAAAEPENLESKQA